jgi:hypothetical protein
MTTALLVSLYLINKEIKLQNLADEQRINKLMFWGNIVMDLCAEVALITLSLNIVISTGGKYNSNECAHLYNFYVREIRIICVLFCLEFVS